MIRKYHNHKLQTTPWHREEEPLNHHETTGRQIKQSNQLPLPQNIDVSQNLYLVTSHFWLIYKHKRFNIFTPPRRHHERDHTPTN